MLAFTVIGSKVIQTANANLSWRGGRDRIGNRLHIVQQTEKGESKERENSMLIEVKITLDVCGHVCMCLIKVSSNSSYTLGLYIVWARIESIESTEFMFEHSTNWIHIHSNEATDRKWLQNIDFLTQSEWRREESRNYRLKKNCRKYRFLRKTTKSSISTHWVYPICRLNSEK